jgi:hypothetical protein
MDGKTLAVLGDHETAYLVGLALTHLGLHDEARRAQE